MRYIAERKLKAYRVADKRLIRIGQEDVNTQLTPIGGEDAVTHLGGEQYWTSNTRGWCT